MPIGISSPARNLFLLGSTGEQVVTNFFKAVDLSASSDGGFFPSNIKYRYSDDSYILSGYASDAQSKGFGWVENRTYNTETAASTQVWDSRIESTSSENVLLRRIIVDNNGDIIAVGETSGTSWIIKYSPSGVVNWQATSFTGNLSYRDVAHDGSSYYACGKTSGTNSVAYVEKFDSNGNPGWGKAAAFSNDDVSFNSIAIADDGNVIAVGRVDDINGVKGLIVKFDSQTGDILWDKTVTSPLKYSNLSSLQESIYLKKIFTDSNGQLYVVGKITSFRTGVLSQQGCLIKFDAEGNIIWQRQTPIDATKLVEYYDVSAEDETEQVIVLGRYYDGTANNEMGILSKYTKNGSLLWRRTIRSSRENSDKFSSITNPPALDADPSFYYVIFHDETPNGVAGEPDRYTFGKISTSGNGLGGFEYLDSTGETIFYDIVSIDNEVAILQDGSVTNSVSDLQSIPYSATKIVFDDFATNIAGKKRQMDSADSFEYSGSPAIRPADFQELNLLGDNIFEGSDFFPDNPSWTIFNSGNGDTITGSGTSGDPYIVTRQSGSSYAQTGVLLPTVTGKSYEFKCVVGSGTGNGSVFRVAEEVWMTNGQQTSNLIKSVGGSNTTLSVRFIATGTQTALGLSVNDPGNASFHSVEAKEIAWTDQSGKGNDGAIAGATHNAAGYWEFDGTDGTNMRMIFDSPLIPATGPWTAEGWVYLNNTNVTKMFMTQYQTGGDPGRFQMFFAGDGSIRMHDGNGIMTGSVGDCPSYSANVWTHVVWQHNDANENMIYVNGVKATSEDQTTTTSLEQVNTLIGSRYNLTSGVNFNGRIGEARVYPKALTAAQVFQNYNATKSKYTTSRASTSPKITTNPIVYNSNLLLNYDFGNDFCIEKSSNVSTSNYQFILDNATTNGAAFGDGQCVSTGYGKVVVGARGETNGVYTGGGKAYIYNASTGALEVTLTPSDISGNDLNFGNSVAICNCSGKIAVTSNNALYLYDADGTNEIIINESSTLPITPPGGNTFGNGLAISGNRVWVSDDNVPSGVSYSGTVYCFNAETGAFIYELRPKNIFDNFTRYGSVIAAGGDKLAIGAENITHPVTGRSTTGRVYLYDVDGRNEKIIEPDTLTTSSLFGLGGIAISYGLFVVGASRQQRTEDPADIGSGEVYVFDTEGDLKFSIRPSDDPANENNDSFGFGSSVAVSSDRIIVGARYYAGNAGGVAGRAYQFTHKGKELQAWFGIGDGEPVVNGSGFGSSMDAVGGTLVIGAGSGSSDSSGRAYVYPLTGTPSGNILNLSSSSYTGTINGATFNPAGYFEFDGPPGLGAGDYINIGTTSTFNWIHDRSESGWVIEGWYWNNRDEEYGALISNNAGTSTVGFYMGQRNDSLFECVINKGTVGTQACRLLSTNVLDHDTWYHIVFVNDNYTVKMYVNGVLQSNAGDQNSFATGSSADAATDLRIAKLADSPTWNLDGEIGEVRIYQTSLSATEVLQNFNATRSKYGV